MPVAYDTFLFGTGISTASVTGSGTELVEVGSFSVFFSHRGYSQSAQGPIFAKYQDGIFNLDFVQISCI